MANRTDDLLAGCVHVLIEQHASGDFTVQPERAPCRVHYTICTGSRKGVRCARCRNGVSAAQRPEATDMKTARAKWWDEVASRGDPMRHPNLLYEAFAAGWEARGG